MSMKLIVVLSILLPLLWNVAVVLYLIDGIRKRTINALKFSVVGVFGLGLTTSTILFAATTAGYGFNLTALGIILIVFGIHAFLALPIVYYLSKKFLVKKFLEWGTKLNRNG